MPRKSDFTHGYHAQDWRTNPPQTFAELVDWHTQRAIDMDDAEFLHPCGPHKEMLGLNAVVGRV